MSNGVLGTEVEPGKYENNDIPGAPDAGEAYDTRFFPRDGWDCSPIGTPQISGPNGIVTKVETDPLSVSSTIEFGDPIVRVDGATTCVIMTRTQVVTTAATKTYFQWFNLSCPIDNVTLLEFVKDEQETIEERTLLSPIIRCETDWPKWALDKAIELLKAGLSVDDALGRVGALLVGTNTVPRLDLPKAAREAFVASAETSGKGWAVHSRADGGCGKPTGPA